MSDHQEFLDALTRERFGTPPTEPERHEVTPTPAETIRRRTILIDTDRESA